MNGEYRTHQKLSIQTIWASTTLGACSSKRNPHLVSLFVCARRTYCETDIDPAHRKLSQLQAVVRYLTGKEPDLECKWAPEFHSLWLYQNTLGTVVSQRTCAFFFVFRLLCLDRWCAAVATNTIWCCGHSSYGSLLDCPHAQHIRVNISTQTHYTDLFCMITLYCFYKLLLCLSLSSPPHFYCLCFSMDEGIETAFLGTRSGLMRFQRYTGIEKRTAK